jgi:hypothetical protein
VAGRRIPLRTWERIRARRRARLAGLAVLLAAGGIPALLWHRAIGVIASDFRLDPGYLLTGWLGYGLILLGLAMMVPVVASIGATPGSRFYPRARAAYAGWGVSLYLLGAALASQVATVVGS